MADVPGAENGDGTDMLIPFVRDGERRRVGKGGARDMLALSMVILSQAKFPCDHTSI